jgi:hypothetical protein
MLRNMRNTSPSLSCAAVAWATKLCGPCSAWQKTEKSLFSSHSCQEIYVSACDSFARFTIRFVRWFNIYILLFFFSFLFFGIRLEGPVGSRELKTRWRNHSLRENSHLQYLHEAGSKGMFKILSWCFVSFINLRWLAAVV